MKKPGLLRLLITTAIVSLLVVIHPLSSQAQTQKPAKNGEHQRTGKFLFERETFGGNGRTCLTCHGRETGTVSPEEAQRRFTADPHDPLFLHDGSDDGLGNGVTRMLAEATILVKIPLPANVRLADDPDARSVTVRRGIPTTLNTPALDPILMYDGRHPDLEAQALGAIRAHFQNTEKPSDEDLRAIAKFQQTSRFFSSPTLRRFARGGPDPELPQGRTPAEKRGRLFFEDVAFGGGNSKPGICAFCHSGPMLNETNEFIPAPPFRRGGRFQSVLVSEFNAAGNPVHDFVFTNPDGATTVVSSPDPGLALATGNANDPDVTGNPNDPETINAFKIPTLWGVARTAPYFHDNSAKTLEEVVEHYALFFEIVTDPAVDSDPVLKLTEQDQADIVAYLELLK
jgi:cytochrome c peroxidase